MKLLESMKEALQTILMLVAIVVFFSALFAGIGILAHGNPLVGLLILIPVVYVGLTVAIYVNK